MFLYTCNMLLYTCIYIYIHVYTCVYVSQESLPSDTKHDVEVFLSTVTDDNSLQSILWYSATHCNTLQHTATCRHILQHAATHRGTSSRPSILLSTATHCNTLENTPILFLPIPPSVVIILSRGLSCVCVIQLNTM